MRELRLDCGGCEDGLGKDLGMQWRRMEMRGRERGRGSAEMFRGIRDLVLVDTASGWY